MGIFPLCVDSNPQSLFSIPSHALAEMLNRISHLQLTGRKNKSDYGTATGTAITELLLLRIFAPHGETPITKEIVWWNIFLMFTALAIRIPAPFALIWGCYVWLGINAALALVLLVIKLLFDRNIAKPAKKKNPKNVKNAAVQEA